MREKIVYGLVAGLALSQLASWILLPKAQSFGVIDMQILIADRAQLLAKSGRMNPRQIHDLAETLKEELQDFAREKGIILLTKSAIAGGNLLEYTNQFVKGG